MVSRVSCSLLRGSGGTADTVDASVDYEGLTYQQRQAIVHRVEAGLWLPDEHCRI